MAAFGSIIIKTMNASAVRLGILSSVATCALVVACSSSKTDSTTTPSTSTAAAVAGPQNTRCNGKPVVVASAAKCHDESAADAGHTHDEPDAAEADAGAPAGDEYGETIYNSEGDDDECKYHVKWESTPVAVNTDVTFSIVATNRNDSSPVAAAEPYAEIFLDETHPAPNTPSKTTETSPGHYTIGPVRFDAPGKWNVRFHFHADCVDGEDSPHGHIAFFVNVQ
ncbi:MAG: hypothetical protein JWP87_1268 [Labilithrix sp.]|nr:hypothetical protein [Labilithrix sp.]